MRASPGHAIVLAAFLAQAGCAQMTRVTGFDQLDVEAGDTFTISADGALPATLHAYLEARDARVTLRQVADRGEFTVWRGTGGATLTLREGTVFATTAFTPDLMSVEAAVPSDWRDAVRPATSPRVHRYVDGDEQVVIRGYECVFSEAVDDPVRRGDTRVPARRTDETCYNPTHGFTNSYWLDGSGQIVQSRQWLGQEIGYLRLNR